MNLKIIFAPLLLATMLDYTPTLHGQIGSQIGAQAVTNSHNLPSRSHTPNFGGQALQQKQEQFAFNVALLILHIFQSGYKCTLGEAYRTTEQALIYAKEGLGISHSKHCERLAIDLNLFDPDSNYIFEDCKEYEALGAYWMSLNPHNIWGGTFRHRKDQNHFEED